LETTGSNDCGNDTDNDDTKVDDDDNDDTNDSMEDILVLAAAVNAAAVVDILEVPESVFVPVPPVVSVVMYDSVDNVDATLPVLIPEDDDNERLYEYFRSV
jgi:hypothetical protein